MDKKEHTVDEEPCPSLGKMAEVSGGMDKAAEFLAQNAVELPPMAPEMEKRIVRKLDWILIPMVRAFVPYGKRTSTSVDSGVDYALALHYCHPGSS